MSEELRFNPNLEEKIEVGETKRYLSEHANCIVFIGNYEPRAVEFYWMCPFILNGQCFVLLIPEYISLQDSIHRRVVKEKKLLGPEEMDRYRMFVLEKLGAGRG